jgi:hypothetical protein
LPGWQSKKRLHMDLLFLLVAGALGLVALLFFLKKRNS